jgi:hypothetical protein
VRNLVIADAGMEAVVISEAAAAEAVGTAVIVTNPARPDRASNFARPPSAPLLKQNAALAC